MSLPEEIRCRLAARSATDLPLARLLELFTKANQALRERSVERIGDVKTPESVRKIA